MSEQIENQAPGTELEETQEKKLVNPCLDFDAVRLAVIYHDAMPSAIKNIVALIDDVEASGIGYVSTAELKDALLKSFNKE